MGSGGGASSGQKEAAKTQAKIVRDLFAITNKGRLAGLGQEASLIRTGGRGGTIPPVLQSLLSGADQGTQSTINDTVNASNKAGIDASYTRGLTNDLTTTGGVNRENARDTYVREAIGKAPELSVQPVQLATQGLQGLVRRGAQADIAKGQRDAQTTQAASGAAAAIASAIIIAAIAA